jgi:hypothetical protein
VWSRGGRVLETDSAQNRYYFEWVNTFFAAFFFSSEITDSAVKIRSQKQNIV